MQCNRRSLNTGMNVETCHDVMSNLNFVTTTTNFYITVIPISGTTNGLWGPGQDVHV